jgi:hypothetical protein
MWRLSQEKLGNVVRELMNMQLPMFVAYKNGKKINEMAGVNNQSAVAVRALSLFPLLLLLTILYRRHRLFITLLASDLYISRMEL